jgi:hypothetical protein
LVIMSCTKVIDSLVLMSCATLFLHMHAVQKVHA